MSTFLEFCSLRFISILWIFHYSYNLSENKFIIQIVYLLLSITHRIYYNKIIK